MEKCEEKYRLCGYCVRSQFFQSLSCCSSTGFHLNEISNKIQGEIPNTNRDYKSVKFIVRKSILPISMAKRVRIFVVVFVGNSNQFTTFIPLSISPAIISTSVVLIGKVKLVASSAQTIFPKHIIFTTTRNSI